MAYLAVILSWWGYHYGTIAGPGETNALDYSIDCVLLVVYWFLINKREPLTVVLTLYCIMFGLYCLWELIRTIRIEEERIRNAIRNAIIVNLNFFVFILYLRIVNSLSNYFQWIQIQNWHYILILFILIIIYRRIMHAVYLPTSYVWFFQGKIEDADRKLIEKAKSVAANARIHLSEFAVGAAVLADSDNIYVGCNIEFDNYSNTIHAEEAAISAAVGAGEKRIVSIAIFTFSDNIYFPCGMCRQSLFELGGKNLRVIACNQNNYETKTIGELLPFGFHL